MATFTIHRRKHWLAPCRTSPFGWCAVTLVWIAFGLIAVTPSASGQQTPWSDRPAESRMNGNPKRERGIADQYGENDMSAALTYGSGFQSRNSANSGGLATFRQQQTAPASSSLARYPLPQPRLSAARPSDFSSTSIAHTEATADNSNSSLPIRSPLERLNQPRTEAPEFHILQQTASHTLHDQGVGHRAADRALQALAASLQTTTTWTAAHPVSPGSLQTNMTNADGWPLGTSPFDRQTSLESRNFSESTFPASYLRALDDSVVGETSRSGFASFRSVINKQDFRLADQPQPGEHYDNVLPQFGCNGLLAPYCETDFSADPIDPWLIYDGASQIDVYQGKTLNANQRPLIELGRPYYFLGQYPESYTFLGETNLVAPRFVVYGDYRTAFATNNQNGNTQSVWAQRLNLDLDLKLTATERFHAFMGPLDHNNSEFTRGVFDNGQYDFFPAFDGQLDTAFFEGDLGAIAGGLGNEVLPFDLPIAIGLMPLLFQNGIWMEDAILGAAATIPARNSPWLDLSNFDVTFFAGIDKLSSPAFAGDDGASRLYGTTTFIEAFDGYLEAGYAYLEDRSLLDRSYHNLGLSYTRRYQSLVSTSYRAIFNMGQDPVGIAQTADGALFLWENSLITSSPYSFVPYFNFFAGFGQPQSVARAAGAGGVLRNTGINFETDGLTGYPTLDASGNDTFGGAIGLNLLSSNFDQQLVAEFAFLNTMGSDPNRIAQGDQYGFGVRYQLPLTNAIILRCDAMVGLLNNADDISGFRCELRHKF